MAEHPFAEMQRLRDLLDPAVTALFTGAAGLQDPGGGTLDFEAELPNRGVSLSALQARLVAGVSMLGALKTDLEAKLVPRGQLEAVKKQANVLLEQIKKAVANINRVEEAGGVTSISPEHWLVNMGDGSTCLGTATLEDIDKTLDAMLTPLHWLRLVTIKNGVEPFSGAVRHLEAFSRKASEEIQKIESSSAKSSNLVKEISEFHAGSKKDAAAASTAKTDAEGDRDKVQKALGQINEILGTANNLNTDVNELQQSINQARPKINDFSSKVDDLVSQANNSIATHNQLEKSFLDKEKEIGDLIGKAESMLGTVTTAYLASSFKEAYDNQAKPLRNSEILYYSSLAILFASVIFAVGILPQFANLPPVVPDPTQSTFVSLLFILSSLSVRAAAVLPALIFVVFSAGRYRQFFRLRQFYLHKFTIASSVAGFRGEAEKHADAVAAAAYEKLLFEPISYMERERARSRTRSILSLPLRRVAEEAKHSMNKSVEG